MSGIEIYDSIDCEEIAEELSEDIESGFLNRDSDVFVVRKATAVSIKGRPEVFEPVLDYFYTEPDLEETLSDMPIVEVKKICYSACDILKELDSKEYPQAPTMLITCQEIAEDLSGYTRGRSKKNDEVVRSVFSKTNGSLPRIPLMVYMADADAAAKISLCKAGDILDEFEKYVGV